METQENFLDRTEKIAVFHTGKSTYRSRTIKELKGFADSFNAE